MCFSNQGFLVPSSLFLDCGNRNRTNLALPWLQIPPNSPISGPFFCKELSLISTGPNNWH